MRATKGKLVWVQANGRHIEIMTAALQAKKTELIRNGYNKNILKIVYL